MASINKPTKIMLIGGHMTPAIAVLDELLLEKEKAKADEQRLKTTQIIWLGHKHSQTGDKNYSAEYRTITTKNIRFISMKTGKLWRKWTLRTLGKGLANLFLIPFGFVYAFYILTVEKPDVIVSFGGYLSVPILTNWLINKINHTRIYIHVQTFKPDLSTKLTKRFARKIFLTWPGSEKYFKKGKVKVVGNPLRPEIRQSRASIKLFNNNLPTLLVLGGNQGANTFNRRLRLPILEKYLEQVNIIHQTGASSLTKDYEIALDQRSRLPEELQERYEIENFISAEDLNNIYNQTSLALSRSGANTVLELMYKGVPAIFVPLPWSSNDEQLENAKIAEATGLARIFKFRQGLTPDELYEEINKAIDQITKHTSFSPKLTWTEAREKAQKQIKLDAAEEIVKEIL